MIDDTYNASPDSMKAALRVLASMEGVKGRRIAGLADMLELGENEKAFHYEVGQFAAEQNIDIVTCYGELSREILKGIADKTDRIVVRHFETREEMKDWLFSTVLPEDIVLLKGSNGMKLKEIANAFLLEEKEPEA